MKRHAGFIIILLLTLVTVVGCSSAHQSKEPGKSFIWELPSEASTVYLLGSLHAARDDIYPLAPDIEDAFDRAENLVVEVDLSHINISELQSLVLDIAKYPPGEDLKSNLPEDLYHKVRDELNELGLNTPLLDMNSFEPWFVAQTIVDVELADLGYKPEYGIDDYFLEKANEEGKNILQLESVEFQLELLDGIPEDVQIMMLEDAIENEELKEDVERMFDAWENGDVSAMESIVFEDLEMRPELEPYYEIMYDERNLGMAEKIEGFLRDDEAYFVIVGAGHLVGENGIINLLNEAGYPARQL